MVSEQNGQGLATLPSLSKRCPECGEAIDHLIAFLEGTSMSAVTVQQEDGEDCLDFRFENFESYDNPIDDYLCPACESVVCKSQADAIDFLKQEAK